jgi:UDP-glucose 4-epimerase
MCDAIIVFGANGFVGRHLTRTLAESGVRVIALVGALPPNPIASVEYGIGAFDTPDAFAPWLSQARLIIHAASRSTPGHSAGKPLFELNANLTPILALLDALQSAPPCDLLYLSSGGTLYGDTSKHPADEIDTIRPKSYYGAGKAAAEHFIHAYAMQFNRAATIVRPSNLYGPGQTLRSGFGVIPTAFDRIQSQVPLSIWGDGFAVRDYLYIDDFIKLCLAIIDQPMPMGSRVFNAASGEGVSLNRLIETIQCITGQTVRTQHDHSRTVDMARVVLNPQAAASQYGWMPETPLAAGLANTWAWWQTQHNGRAQ